MFVTYFNCSLCIGALLLYGAHASSLKFKSPDTQRNHEERLAHLEGLISGLHADKQRLHHEVRTLKTGLHQRLDRGNTSSRQLPSNARVSASNPIVFSAEVSQVEIRSLVLNQRIIFDEVLTNIGFAYNPESGVFLAPVNGLYLFNMAMMVDPGLDGDLHLAVNGTDVAYMYADSRGTQTLSSTSRTVILQLIRGSQVEVRNTFAGPQTIHGHKFTTFSGFLMHSFETN